MAAKERIQSGPIAARAAHENQVPTPAAGQPIALRIPDAATVSGLSRTTLYAEMDRGQLPFVKVGARRLILYADLVAFLVQRRTRLA